MTQSFLIGIILLLSGYTCSRKGSTTPESSAELSADTTKTVSLINFETDIKPILQTRCTPCHFPGGKMYERLPFDKPETIKTHPEGILKRIKDADELNKLKAFLDQLPE